MKQAIALICAALFLSLTGPRTLEDQVENIAATHLNSSENPGLAIGIISGGEESIYAFGTKEMNGKSRIDANSIFEIGSITKVFTGIMLADEVINGRMQLTDNIARYLPVGSDAAQRVNMLQLSTHSSGAPRLADNFWSSVSDNGNPYASYSERELYSYLENMKLRGTPGTHYSYSNVGTGILGNILCKQYGTSYEELVKKKVCEPCGMTSTVMNIPSKETANLAKGHSKGRVVNNWDFQDATAGQGALRSSVKDMMSFMRHNLSPSGELEAAINLASQTHFTDNRTGQMMGLGWHIGWFNEHKYLEHTGGTGGYRSFIGLIPGTNTGVVVLGNSDNDVAAIGLKLLEAAAKNEKDNRKTIVAN